MIPKKAFGVVLLFDDDSTKLIRNIWYNISSVGLSSFLIENDDLPHISLGICNNIDCDQAQDHLLQYIAFIEPFNITLNHIGIFPGTGVVFYGINMTSHIINLHMQFTDLFNEIAEGPYEKYLPGQWIPHVTLAYDLPPDQISKTIAIVQKTELPITCRVEKIALIEFPPWKECFALQLR